MLVKSIRICSPGISRQTAWEVYSVGLLVKSTWNSMNSKHQNWRIGPSAIPIHYCEVIQILQVLQRHRYPILLNHCKVHLQRQNSISNQADSDTIKLLQSMLETAKPGSCRSFTSVNTGQMLIRKLVYRLSCTEVGVEPGGCEICVPPSPDSLATSPLLSPAGQARQYKEKSSDRRRTVQGPSKYRLQVAWADYYSPEFTCRVIMDSKKTRDSRPANMSRILACLYQ